MKICVDKNHLLVIENENIPQVKEYTYNVGGYMFSDFDKGIIVLSKKNWKVINLKNLSDNMSVAYIKDEGRRTRVAELELVAFEDALMVFQGFNEESGEKYFFLPNIQEKELAKKNSILQKLGSAYELKKTEKGIVVELQNVNGVNGVNGVNQILSFLLGLVVLYGKFEAKTGFLASCKIQLPLFGQYLSMQEKLDAMLAFLRDQGMFLKSDKLQTSNGIVYQISCTDYEILELFAKRYEPVEKFEKITKRDFTAEMKANLLEFVKNDSQIPEEGRKEVIALIEKGVVKLLTK